MKLKKNWLLYLAVLMVLFGIPLTFSGTASAVRYNPDGAVQNPTTGVYELPADLGACFDGTTTINGLYLNRPDCLNADNPTLFAITTRSVCQTPVQIASPAGYDLNSGTATWNRCSKPMYATDQATCEGAGGSWDAFIRCSKQVTNADCTALGTALGITVTAGGTSTTPTCTTTGLTATVCAAGGTAASGAPWMGSAAVSGAITTCTIYIGNDSAACAAVGGGTLSSTSTDETRGYCSNNWVFKQVAGTGATATTTGTGGSLTTVEARACLRCHNSTYQAEEAFAEPEKYIKASHKNASRKITAGKKWAQINENTGAEIFSIFDNYKDRAINWVTGLIEAVAGSGTFTDWYWYWGYFFEDPSDGSDIAENSVSSTTGLPTTNFRACAFCHGTGFSAENTQVLTKEPVKTWPAITWDGTTTYAPGSTPGKVNLRTGFIRQSDDSLAPSTADCTALGGVISGTGTSRVCRIAPANTTQNTCVKGGNSIPGSVDWAGAWIGSWSASTGCSITLGYKYNSWDEFGVLCSNCHNSVDGGHNNSSTGTRKNVPRPTVAQPAYGAQVNAVCLQCHAKASSGTGQLTAPTSKPLAASAYITTGHPNYHGSQYMNSPHAKFSGTYDQITDTTKYNSAFASTYGGCEGCHDPHGSVRENLLEPELMGSSVAEDGIKRTCASCHTTYSDSDTIAITSINHPTGANTPMGTEAAPTDGCVICHMPSNQHLFRISVDNVTPKADGTYTDAAWTPVTGTRSACGQCHVAGGVAFEISAAQASAAAKDMHSGGSSATNADCLTCHAAANTVGAPEIIPGTNHHGLHVNCTVCHVGGHNGPLPVKYKNSFCLTCHTNSGPYAVHHAVSSVTDKCVSCHTIPGVTVPPMTTRDQITAGCLSCHNAPQGSKKAIVPNSTYGIDNHHRGSSSKHFTSTTNDYACKGCHGAGKTTLAATGLSGTPFCAECHTVVQSGTGKNHHEGVCLDCHKASGAFSGTFGAGVTSGQVPSCLVCHDGNTTSSNVPGPGPIRQGINHHLGECTTCHGALGGVAAATIDPNDRTSITNGCLVCHSGVVNKLGGGALAAIVPHSDYGTDNHHRGSSTAHAGYKGCLACHGAAGGLPFVKGPVAGNCTECHTVVQSGPAQDHHAGSCTYCHHTDGSFSGAYGAGVTSGQTTNCGVCHADTTPTVLINHPTKPVAPTCQDCHGAGGQVPTFASACNPCHGGSAGPAAAVAPAPYLTAERLAKGAMTIHKNLAPKAIITLIATDTAATAGVQVKVGAAVQVTDASTDVNGNLATIIVDWGDKTSVTIAPGATTPVKTYAKKGARTITLTAIDAKGLKSKATVKIDVVK